MWQIFLDISKGNSRYQVLALQAGATTARKTQEPQGLGLQKHSRNMPEDASSKSWRRTLKGQEKGKSGQGQQGQSQITECAGHWHTAQSLLWISSLGSQEVVHGVGRFSHCVPGARGIWKYAGDPTPLHTLLSAQSEPFCCLLCPGLQIKSKTRNLSWALRKTSPLSLWVHLFCSPHKAERSWAKCFPRQWGREHTDSYD